MRSQALTPTRESYSTVSNLPLETAVSATGWPNDRNPSSMHTRFLVIRSKTDRDALVRLQSDPIIRGLQQAVSVPARVVSPTDMSEVVEGSCVIFHYNDVAAVKAVKQIAGAVANLTIICLCSDIYTFRWYLDVHDIVDFYIVPTDLHRRTLMSQVYKPVYTLPECIDPIVGASQSNGATFPVKQSTRVLWFGYPESFEKGMVSLVPVLKTNVCEKSIDSFELIVGMDRFENRFDIPATPFVNENFADQARTFDYCLLSHFSLDLSLNSYIKSPNKLLTSLLIGLIPIASRTPNYENLLRSFGLEKFLYDSPSDLDRILKRLDPVADSEAVRESGILEAIITRYSEANVTCDFLRILSEFGQRDESAQLSINPATLPAKRAELRISEHLADFFPSALRAMRWRLGRY
jgi:hypothetical protein